MKRLGLFLFVILFSLNFVLADVVINEFEQNPVLGSEWIELYNNGGSTVNLNLWTLEDGLSSPGTIHTFSTLPVSEIVAGGYLSVDVSGLNNPNEFVTLKDSVGTVIDQTPTLDEASQTNNCWARVPNSVDTDSLSDWAFQTCSRDATNDLSIGGININGFGDYATIQDAIDAASDGDVINVGVGSYEEDLVFPEGKENLELNGSGRDVTTIKGVATSGAPNIQIHTVDGIKMHGFTIESPDVYLTSPGGIIFSGKNIEIYDNIFMSNFQVTDSYTIVMQTYRSQYVPAFGIWKEHDISGLHIHDNIFNSSGESDFGYEGLYINRDSGVGNIVIEDNIFSGTAYRGILTERSKVLIQNNVFQDFVGKGFGIVARDLGDSSGFDPEVYGGLPRPQENIQILNNTVNGFNETDSSGILLGYLGGDQELVNIVLNGNLIQGNDKGVIVSSSADEIEINYNEIINNVVGVQNDNLEILDAENNYWGSCEGPSGSDVTGNVDFTPWLGVCVEELSQSQSCVLPTDDLNLYANVTSSLGACVGDVIFSVNESGTWTNHTGLIAGAGSPGNYFVQLNNSLLISGQTIGYEVFVDDCYEHLDNNMSSFYVNHQTQLGVSPTNPNGMNEWYITEPSFTLVNLDSSTLSYRWDSQGTHDYTGPFGLENSLNNGNVTGGIQELNYFANLTCGRMEEENTININFDFLSPVIKDMEPTGEVNSNGNVELYAYIDEMYQSNSGVNLSSVEMFLDDVKVNASVMEEGELDASVLFMISSLPEGTHEVKVIASDNSGRVSVKTWEFDAVQLELFTLQINSPSLDLYDDRRVVFNLSVSESVDELSYLDLADRRPRERRLCSRDCLEYGEFRERKLSFQDGYHNITVFAKGYNGLVVQENFDFIIDSKDPRVLRTEPTRGFTDGTFNVTFREDNPINLTLYYGNKTNTMMKEFNISECVVDRSNMACSQHADLNIFDGQEIGYWFNLTDINGNSDVSREREVEVDKTNPVVNEFDYTIDRRRVEFLFRVDEQNFDEINYIDWSDGDRARERKLCTRLRFGFCETRKSFSTGEHNLTINILDEAGNSATINDVVFNIA